MLAVLSDIHGNLPALMAVVADAEARGCRRFVNLGDTLSGPLWPAETADWLMARGWPTIAGNHERQLLTLPRGRMGPSDAFAHRALGAHHRAWLAAQPARLDFDDVLCVHGAPASDLEHLMYVRRGNGLRLADAPTVAVRLAGEAARVVLCGHSHLPGSLALPGGRLVANPGSVGLQAYDDDEPRPYRVEVGDARARYGLFDWDRLDLIDVAYDHEAAARRAADNGRPDWAVALRTGRMT